MQRIGLEKLMFETYSGFYSESEIKLIKSVILVWYSTS